MLPATPTVALRLWVFQQKSVLCHKDYYSWKDSWNETEHSKHLELAQHFGYRQWNVNNDTDHGQAGHRLHPSITPTLLHRPNFPWQQRLVSDYSSDATNGEQVCKVSNPK